MSLRKRLLILICVALFSVSGASAGEIEEAKLLGSRIHMDVPSSFEPMSEELLKLKYPNGNPPGHVLSAEDGSVTITFNHTSSPMDPDKLGELLHGMEMAYQINNPSATWHRSEITGINSRAWSYMDLHTKAGDGEVRNLILGTPLDGRLLIISVNMPKELEELWLPGALEMIESLEVLE